MIEGDRRAPGRILVADAMEAVSPQTPIPPLRGATVDGRLRRDGGMEGRVQTGDVIRSRYELRGTVHEMESERVVQRSEVGRVIESLSHRLVDHRVVLQTAPVDDAMPYRSHVGEVERVEQLFELFVPVR